MCSTVNIAMWQRRKGRRRHRLMRVLLTGATGFVGTMLCSRLAESGYRVRAALHRDGPVPAAVAEAVVVGDIGPDTDWMRALRDVELVLHVAAVGRCARGPGRASLRDDQLARHAATRVGCGSSRR